MSDTTEEWLAKQTYFRPFLLPPVQPGGKPERTTITLPCCRCGDERRGPEGGCCGACGNAIPGPGDRFYTR